MYNRYPTFLCISYHAYQILQLNTRKLRCTTHVNCLKDDKGFIALMFYWQSPENQVKKTNWCSIRTTDFFWHTSNKNHFPVPFSLSKGRVGIAVQSKTYHTPGRTSHYLSQSPNWKDLELTTKNNLVKEIARDSVFPDSCK